MKENKQEESILDSIKFGAAVGVKWVLIVIVATVLVDFIGDNINLEWRTPVIIERRKTNFITPLKQEGEKTEPEQTEKEDEITPVSSGGDYRMWSGVASWYGAGEGECIGCKVYWDNEGIYYLMRNSERLDDTRKTVALGEQFLIDNSDIVEIGDWVVVTNTENGLKEEVEITDSGQFDTQEGRIADLSKALRDSLACVNCNVTVETY